MKNKLIKFIIKNKLYILISGIFIISTIINIYFRDTIADETEYLKEALVMSKCIQTGNWFGNYGVGLHGFLLKIPVALLFILTGPNVIVARTLNLVFAILSCLLFYKILNNKQLGLEKYSFIGTLLLATNFQFITTTPTFLKEPSLIFFVLVFINEIIDKKRDFLIGIILLLILDSKEYVFFIFSIALTIQILIQRKKIVTRSLLIFSPSLIFLFLMFFTSLIPLNIFIASTLNLTQTTATDNYQIRHFSAKYATVNLTDTSTIIPTNVPTSTMLSKSKQIKNFKLFYSYFIKLFYPRVFSFLSMPLIILIPALINSFILFKRWYLQKNYYLLSLILIFWIYFIVYMAYTSIGRYLYPIFPIIYIIFINFLVSDIYQNSKTKLYILIFSSSLMFISLFFDQGLILPKLTIYIILSLTPCLLLIKKTKKINYKLIPYLICLFSLGSSFVFFVTQDQISNSIPWGIDRECKQIVQELPKNINVLINEIGWTQLANFYNNETYNPAEWQWTIKNWIPKKKLLKTIGAKRIYNNSWENEKELRTIITNHQIQYIAFIDSSIITKQFTQQSQIDFLLDKKWLKIEKIIKFKNKHFYLFKINKGFKDYSNEIRNYNINKISINIDIKKDIGQQLGTLFSINDENGTNIAGAGFIESHSYFIKDNNRNLQFFIKENDNSQINKIKENFDSTHIRLMSNGKDLLTSNNLVESDNIPDNWKYDNGTFTKIDNNFNWITFVNNKPMKFYPNKITYDDIEILNTKVKSTFYYSNGKLYIFTNTNNPKLEVCSWTYEEKQINKNGCKQFDIPYPRTNPIAFGNLSNQTIIALNNGIILNYSNDSISIINKEDEGKGVQFYTTLNYYDKMLLGEYPYGQIYSYDGIKLIKENNNIPPLGTSGRELQTLTIYRGDIYAGVWPWGELFKNNNLNSDDWKLVKRVFSEPYINDPGIAPYRNIIQPNFKYRNIELNAWGQRIVSLVPFEKSLFLSTSNKGGDKYSKEVNFVKNPNEYGAIWELKANTNISCPFVWKENSIIDFNFFDHLVIIYQDNNLLCKTILQNNYISLLKKNKLIIGNGIYGKFNGEITITP